MLRTTLEFARFIFIGCCLTICIYAFAKPDRREPQPKEKPVPNIAGPSQFGLIVQNGRKVKINGHERWFVDVGEIRKDGTLLVEWVHRDTGKVAIGLYTINADGSIRGSWGWGENVTEDGQGGYDGLTSGERLRQGRKLDL